MNNRSLRGCRFLVVEDEYLIPDAMQRALDHKGARVVGPAPSVRKALQLVATEADIDGALLDINLDSEQVFPVAEALQARGIPFLFATGYSQGDVPQAWRHVPRLEKPVDIDRIARALWSRDEP